MPADNAWSAVAKQWLAAAEEDQALGQRSLEPPALPRGAVFHAQQAAEKALKAFLAWHDLPFKRTHDLVELLRQCTSVEPNFATLEETAQILTPYAITGRYPDVAGDLTPTIIQAEDALREARVFLTSCSCASRRRCDRDSATAHGSA